jgi:hypothetical protein
MYMKWFYILFALAIFISLASCSEKPITTNMSQEQFTARLDSAAQISFLKIKKELDYDYKVRWDILKKAKVDSILGHPKVYNNDVNLPIDISDTTLDRNAINNENINN